MPRLPESGPEDPGPFSFADAARVRRILAAAGFADVALTPVDLELDLANGGGLEAAVEIAQQIGAASRALEGQPAAACAAAIAEIRAAFAPYQRGDACRSARRSGSSRRSIGDVTALSRQPWQPRVEQRNARSFEVGSVAGDDSHAVRQGSRSDHCIAIRHWIWNEELGAASRHCHVEWQDAIGEGQENLIVQPFAKNGPLHVIPPLDAKHAQLQLEDRDC